MRRKVTAAALAAFRVALRPPVGEVPFWFVQVLVVGLAAAQISMDLLMPGAPRALPARLPVALLLVPVGYAALNYGLAGSAATALWASLLWLPDLLLPSGGGRPVNDAIELVVVDAVAVFVGYHIDSERSERARVAQAEVEHHSAETRFRQLFDTNAAPILVLDEGGRIRQANPAAHALVAGELLGAPIRDVLGCTIGELGSCAGRTVRLTSPAGEARDFRVHATHIAPTPFARGLTQVVLADVTEERAAGMRVRHFAELLLGAQEEERRRVAQELHDEPLQLLVYLARHLEQLATRPGLPAETAEAIVAARRQVLEIAGRIRSVVGGLRPPALEQLGLVAAVRGLLADIEDEELRAELRAAAPEAPLAPGLALGAFRIVQEAVNNVVRHAAARRISVAIDVGAHGLAREVRDDGRGFDPVLRATRPDLTRLGTLGMRERAEMLGGKIEFDSAPGRGTVVRALLPLGY